MILPFTRDELTHSVTRRFDFVADAVPQNEAVVGPGHRLTYQQLRQCALALAHQITRVLGDAPGQVAIMSTADAGRIIAMLATLYAGRAFVVLDPSFPAARCASLIEDGLCSLLVTENLPDLVGHPAHTTCAISKLAFDLNALPDCVEARDLPRSSSDQLACIVYTSGSSGKPKGIVRTHRNLLHRAWLDSVEDGVQTSDRQCIISSGAFASAASEAISTLLCGACICLYNFAAHGLSALGSWLVTERISRFHPPVALAREWCARATEPIHNHALRYVRLSGSRVLRQDFVAMRRQLPGHWQINSSYATTETTTVCRISSDKLDDFDDGQLPAGKPVADKNIALVDEAGNRVKQGDVGEILVSSHFTSTEYWRQPEQTALRFSTLVNGEICFRTGDLGRIDATGNLFVLGRVDDVVKIRGFRVEPSDVERVLRSHEAIADALVQPITNSLGNHELCAYVVVKHGRTANDEVLRSWVGKQLPPFMIPRHVVFLDQMPLTINGKIDTNALPKPKLPAQPEISAGAALRAEQLVRQAWQDVLGHDVIDPNARFLDVGGDSFAAAQLEIRLTGYFQRPIRLSDLIRRPTIASQAAWIEQQVGDAGDLRSPCQLVPLRQSTHSATLYLIPGNTGGLEYGHALASLLENINVVGVLPAFDDRGIFEATSFEKLARQLALEILSDAKSTPINLIGPCGGGKLALEVGRQLEFMGATINRVMIVDAPGTSDSRTLGAPSVPGAIRWLFGGLRSLAQAAGGEGLITAGRYVAASARMTVHRITKPLSRRHTSLERLRIDVFGHMSRTYVRGHYSFPVCLIRGAWSQLGFRYADRTPDLGWGKHCPDLRIRFVPGTHSAMYLPPFARALTRVVVAEIDAQKLKT